MELLASSIPATVSPLSYIMYYPDSGLKGRRDGAGSTEATEMILNNLFYITAKVRIFNELKSEIFFDLNPRIFSHD